LAPSVEKKLEICLPIEQRAHYRKVTDQKIIRNEKISRNEQVAHLYAFAFNNGTVNGENPNQKALQKLRDEAPPSAKEKYDNSLEFLDLWCPKFSGGK
jgi:spore cortex formation protein SpoVR/YcgB (stage V sporulation)